MGRSRGVDAVRARRSDPTPRPREPGLPTPLPLLANETVVEQPVDLGSLTQRYASWAADFIARRQGQEAPWYLMASLNHVHSPNSCAARWCGATPSAVTDAVADADWLVSQLLDALDAAGAADDTLVLLTSDNGAPLSNDARGNHPLRGGKTQVWEGGFREPGMARWPGVVAPRTTTLAVAATVDIHVTLLKLAGLEAFDPDGRDLGPVLRGEKNATGHDCYPFWNVH